jgi:hypothetical protein
LPLIRCLGLVALAPPGRRHPRTVLTVRCEHTMEACQIYSRPRHQGGQSCDEVQRLEDQPRAISVTYSCLNNISPYTRRSAIAGRVTAPYISPQLSVIQLASWENASCQARSARV